MDAPTPLSEAKPEAKPEAKTEDSMSRFMAAADDAYIHHGYRGATIRKICEQAGVSLATLHRHWPNKEALFYEVFARHFGPIHQAQHERLDQLMASMPHGENPTAKAIIEAFFEPAFSLGAANGSRNNVYCRALMDPSPEAKKIVAALIGDARSRLIGLLRTALKDQDDSHFFVSINLVLGSYLFVQAFAHQTAMAMGFDEGMIDPAQMAQLMAHRLSQGLEQEA